MFFIHFFFLTFYIKIPTESNPQNHKYLLSPISATLKVVLNRDPVPDMDIPKMTLNFVFDQVALSLNTYQYRDILDTMVYFQRANKYGKYNHYRPVVSIQQDPMAYWKFMIKYKLKEIKKSRKQWKWESMQKMKENRLEYIELYCKKKKLKKGLPPDENERLEQLEEDLEYETVILYVNYLLYFNIVYLY